MSKRITLEEAIKAHKIMAGIQPENNAFQQVVEWLEELKSYRDLIANADEIVKTTYGVVITEGYADVMAQMKDIYKKKVRERHDNKLGEAN